MDNLVELSEAEMMRTRRSPFEPVAALYNNKFRETRRLYLTRYAQDLVSAFRRLQDEGHIEIVTTAATHAFLPAFEKYPEAVRRQIKIGVKSYMNNFGKQPSGFWLPECGYYNGLDSFLKEAGIKYFFLESHGIIRGAPRPGYSIFRPALTGSGLVAFGRDFKSARQVWCASSGYPGDPSYRDFYRDIGFDLPTDYTGKFTRFGGIRTFTGMKYHCVTGRTAEKLPYNRAKAMNRAAEHAAHFINSRESDASRLAGYGFSPLIFSAFDAELFGHWWFEGIEWLEAVLRKMSESRSLRIITPAEYSSIHSAEHMEVIRPHPSSWGEGGYSSIWIGKTGIFIRWQRG
ncbi:MAG: hypothetical protein HY099_05555 [Nitrospirae bacterium]|nr:hypothetical protein [Nitrospirota bacterium]